MHNLTLLEECYKKYIRSLYYWIPEGIFTVNLELLEHFDLLHFRTFNSREPLLSQNFHIVDSPEKITLVNKEFVIWIMSDHIDHIPVTYTLIALNRGEYPVLELAFVASGVYNTSKIVLRILEKFLVEIQENEDMIKDLKESWDKN